MTEVGGFVIEGTHKCIVFQKVEPEEDGGAILYTVNILDKNDETGTVVPAGLLFGPNAFEECFHVLMSRKPKRVEANG